MHIHASPMKHLGQVQGLCMRCSLREEQGNSVEQDPRATPEGKGPHDGSVFTAGWLTSGESRWDHWTVERSRWKV